MESADDVSTLKFAQGAIAALNSIELDTEQLYAEAKKEEKEEKEKEEE